MLFLMQRQEKISKELLQKQDISLWASMQGIVPAGVTKVNGK